MFCHPPPPSPPPRGGRECSGIPLPLVGRGQGWGEPRTEMFCHPPPPPPPPPPGGGGAGGFPPPPRGVGGAPTLAVLPSSTPYPRIASRTRSSAASRRMSSAAPPPYTSSCPISKSTGTASGVTWSRAA